MSKPAFTPGPWKAIWIGSDLSMNGVGHAEVNGPKGIVCNCEESSVEETLANARLIAAAPEMLEALQSYIDDIDGKRLQNGMELEAHMRAAIAKATGGAE